MRSYRISIPIPQVVIERICAGWHYVRTGIGIRGDELIAVSERYLRSCLPSRQESILGIAGGLLSGLGWANIFAWIILPPNLARFLVGWTCSIIGGYCLLRQRALRNARRLFRKSEEAKRV